MSKIRITTLPNGDQWFPMNVDGRSIRVQIFKDRSPFYTARFEHGGKPYLRTSGTDVPAVAAKILREKVRQVLHGQVEASKSRHEGCTVGDVVRRYREQAPVARLVKERVARENCNALIRLVRGALAPQANPENVRLRDVDWNASFAGYVKHLEARAAEVRETDAWAVKRVPITANSCLRMARSLFTSRALALYAGLALPDPLPLSQVTLMAGTPDVSYDPAVWTNLEAMKEDLTKLRYAEPLVWVAVALAANTGLRRSEMEAMRWSWLERTAAGMVIAIVERPDFKPKRGGRRVAVAPGLVAQMEEFRSRSGADYVLGATPGDRRHVLTEASTWVKKWQRAGARTKKTLHELRKHFGSVLLTAHGLERTAEALGHAPGSVVTRKHYATFLTSTPAVEVL